MGGHGFSVWSGCSTMERVGLLWSNGKEPDANGWVQMCTRRSNSVLEKSLMLLRFRGLKCN